MAATPKHRRSKRRQRNTRSQDSHKAQLPQLVRLENGKLVPAHTVTPLNPIYKGIQYIRSKVQKAK